MKDATVQYFPLNIHWTISFHFTILRTNIGMWVVCNCLTIAGLVWIDCFQMYTIIAFGLVAHHELTFAGNLILTSCTMWHVVTNWMVWNACFILITPILVISIYAGVKFPHSFCICPFHNPGNQHILHKSGFQAHIKCFPVLLYTSSYCISHRGNPAHLTHEDNQPCHHKTKVLESRVLHSLHTSVKEKWAEMPISLRWMDRNGHF